MTIITTQSRITYAGDNATVLFPIPFEFFLNSDITAAKLGTNGVQTILVLNVDYTLSGANVPGGGSATKTTPLLTGETLALFLNPPISQQSHYISNSPFPSATLENDIDRQTQVSQRLQDQISRTLRAPDADPASVVAGFLLPSSITRAGTFLAFDSTGMPVTILPPNLSPANGTPAYAQTAAEQGAGIVPTNFGYSPGTVLRYGADPLGILDSTAAVQKAINAMQAGGGGLVFFPPGSYAVSPNIGITSSVALVGYGRFFTTIKWTSTTGTIFNVASDQAIYVTGLQFLGPTNSTAGRMIQIAGSGTQNTFSIIKECLFSGGYSQVYSITSETLTVKDNYFTGFQQSGLHIENQFNADAGDSTAYNNTFSNSPNTTTSVCIEQFSSGGLKVLSNKMNTGAYGYRLVMASGSATSDVIVIGNSIENQAIAGINISSSGGGAVWTNFDISSNQIGLVPAGITCTLSYAATSGWTVGTNRISLNTAAAGVGISLQWVSGVNLSGNVLFPGAVTQSAIVTDANTSGNVGINTYQNTWAQKLNVGSALYVAPSWMEAGVQAVTCSTAYGSLFSATVAVVFPTPFDSAPTVDCDFGSVTGGISAEASSITKTGFNLLCVSVTSGGAGNCNYRARGVI